MTVPQERIRRGSGFRAKARVFARNWQNFRQNLKSLRGHDPDEGGVEVLLINRCTPRVATEERSEGSRRGSV